MFGIKIVKLVFNSDVPEAPGKPEVTAVDRKQITITWTPPKSDGGSPVTGYIIEKKETSSTRWTQAVKDSVTETSFTVKDLIEGKEYVFHVAAVNKAGTSPFSEPSEPKITKPPYGKIHIYVFVDILSILCVQHWLNCVKLFLFLFIRRARGTK